MIVLGWPAPELSPNSRCHWSKKSAVRAHARFEGFIEAKAANAPAGRNIAITFHAPDKRKRDIDNMLASVKSHLDGISQAIGVDDSEWSITITKGEVRKGGCVIVEVSA